ncbi:MAG: hypothetical protein RL087_1596, partial [Pseudomonadota bacterium]
MASGGGAPVADAYLTGEISEPQ